MTIRAEMFTPHVLLSAPRRSTGVPNADGTRVLYTSSTYSFDEHKKTSELRSLDTKSGESTLLTSEDGVSDPVWLEGEDGDFACLKSGKEGITEIIVASAAKGSNWDNVYVAGKIEAPANSLKLSKLDSNKFAVAVAAQAYPDGSLFNPEKATKTQSTGKLYSGLFVRHWDDYVGKEKNALWYGTLTRTSKEGKFELSGLVNALKGTSLESPIAPFGGTDSFDLNGGIIFVSKDPKLDPALNSKCNAYLIELSTFEEATAPKPASFELPEYEGASTSPVFSPDGSKAAFLSMKTPGYESDQNKIFLIPDVKSRVAINTLHESSLKWDRSPQNVSFSHDSKTLYFSAEDDGYGRLFQLSLDSDFRRGSLKQLSKHGYVSDVRPLASGAIFVSGSSLVDNSNYSILDPAEEEEKIETWSHSASRSGSSLGLSKSQVSSIRFPASNPSVNKEVHAWVVKPSTFDKSKKYPLALLIHGGPQGSWADSWSTRWNPAVFAEQGYVVVSPNVTGSTGYGQAFTNAIRKDWGGAPYNDLVNCFKYIEENMPEVDVSRAVALGASYGGYMVNWLNGHDLGRKFKALVCHDGIFSMGGLLATEELYFPFYDLGGTPWGDPAKSATGKQTQLQGSAALASKVFGKGSIQAWQKNDPSHYLENWATPQLVIHNSKDYRLCISEGLAAFNVLQARGVESQFLTFPDENHFVLKPENSLVWHKTVLNWINSYVGLPKYTEEDEQSDAFFGGKREVNEQVVDMLALGKPET